MQPMTNDEKQRILEDNPSASPSEIEEYERLLSERFTMDPDPVAPAAAPMAIDGKDEEGQRHFVERRIGELHRKLFLRSVREELKR